MRGQIVECHVDMRRTALRPQSLVYFSRSAALEAFEMACRGVKARYLSLPLEANYSRKLCWSRALRLPELLSSLPAPAPLLSDDFQDVGGRRMSRFRYLDARRHHTLLAHSLLQASQARDAWCFTGPSAIPRTSAVCRMLLIG